MERDQWIELLQKLLLARGPGGQEDEVRHLCAQALEGVCDELQVDPAGNLIGVIRAATPASPESAIKLMAHLDEIAMVVKLIDADGTLQVTALGGAQPISFGACPVDILAAQGSLPGVLSFGSMHNSGESQQGQDVLSGQVAWDDVHVVTRLSRDALIERGVRPGSRVVLSQHWRQLFRVNDALAAHFMDDRAPLVALILAARRLAGRRQALRQDVWFVCTTLEEESNAGAMYAAARLPGETTIAVEVGPVLDEYGTRLSADPIINTGDKKGYYTRDVVQGLVAATEVAGVGAQVALLVDFASDASAVMSAGHCARGGCIAIPTENTHGYEVVLEAGIEACAATLVEYVLANPATPQ